VSRARQPIVAASVSLLAFGGCVAAFLPPLNQQTLESLPLTIVLGIALAVSLILHLVFVGVAAQRLGRSALWWVVLALLLFPIASIVGLILFEWFSEEQNQAQGHGAA
jgi:drug/metabolite transporter (DMT)-like permease